MEKTFVYIDGFNLYYGALKGTQYRWLDLAELCRLMLPPNDVQRTNYYTARVGARIGDPDQPIRQQTYLRALATLPTVRVHFGHYLSHPVWMPLESPPQDGPRFARVIRTEEKGSDVNIATHLVSDAYENAFDVAVLITNDSDLREPVDLVRNRLGKRVGNAPGQVDDSYLPSRESVNVTLRRSQKLASAASTTIAFGSAGKPRAPEYGHVAVG